MKRLCGLLFLIGLLPARPVAAQTSGSWVEEQVAAWYPMALKMARGRWGVAVADHTGWPIAAIALTYPDDAAKDAAQLAALLAPAAAELGRRIGGASPR